MRSQSSKLLHTSNVYYNEPSAALASLLVTLTQSEGGLGYPGGAQHPTGAPGAKVFFANTGTEANEGALKVARKVGKDRGGPTKTEMVCFQQSFHGRSFGALSVTSNSKYQDPFAPLVPGVRVGELNQSEGLEELITENTCAVIVEPIQGEGGVHSADVQWMRELVGRARDTGAVVIFDEIQVSVSHSSDRIGPGFVGDKRRHSGIFPNRSTSEEMENSTCSDPRQTHILISGLNC
jgi:acetylornithine aminotransferase